MTQRFCILMAGLALAAGLAMAAGDPLRGQLEGGHDAPSPKGAGRPLAQVTPPVIEGLPPDSYYGRLQAEFRSVGPAGFAAGENDLAALDGIKSGVVEDVQNLPFAQAKVFAVTAKPKKYWDADFRLANAVPVRKGDCLFVVFWAKGKKAPQRVDDGDGATLQPYIRSSLGNFPKGRVNNFYDCKMLTEKWERYFIRTGPLPMDFPTGTLEFVGMIGHKAQVVEVGGIAWMVFPEGAALANLPKPSWEYAGRAPDAPWRQEAERRIDAVRKGPLTIEVVDAAGRPVSNAAVAVRMKQHAFHFGAAISVAAFSGKNKGMTPADVAKYKGISSQYYNSIVIDNELKWVYFESGRANGWKDTRDCLQFYHDQGKNIRGHVLVWPTTYRMPEALKSKMQADPSSLGDTVRNHIIEEVTAFKPWIHDWDVTNETEVNRDFMDVLGPEGMVDWYKTVRAVDPRVRLTFNEPSFGPPGMEIGSFPESLLNDKCRGWVDYLIQQGAPLDALGAQAHGGRAGKDFGGKTGPEGLWAHFDYLSGRYGRKLQYTELDVNLGDPTDPDQVAYQADLLRDSMIIAFAHPAFTGITQWGFWEGAHYAPAAALWARDWTLKPNGKAYLDLVFKRWWTDADLTTGGDGRCTVRAFYGDYEIRVAGGQVAPVTRRFSAGDGPVQIKLE